jgi:hypothetical protein
MAFQESGRVDKKLPRRLQHVAGPFDDDDTDEPLTG